MMSMTVDKIADNILSNRMNKQEAINRFESLSEDEKDLLVSKLKLKLAGKEYVSGEKILAKKSHSLLKAIDQRVLRDKHREFIKALSADYEKFVPESKKNVIKYQDTFVDQRRPFHLIKDLKNIHFQITYKKAQGAYVYDIDGNRYIDISGDMGVNIFGHKPDFIINAIKASLDQGIPLAGYSETIFKSAELFCQITGHERALFTQSGTEAVMFAVRIARAATNRKKVVIFDGSYHGLSDAVTAIKDEEGRSLSVGPGMLQEFADQLIVLDYGNMQHLDVIEEKSEDIAAILVEPVQSRHPYRKPIEFLREIRKLTLEKDIPLIFDEMITGFRICPRGAQGYFGIRADIATYGKIPGGGMPTGIVAGLKKYMNFIDGGAWNFDDESMPKTRRTSMAGTHSQNPIKISSVFATLSEISKKCSNSVNCDNCSCFQRDLNENTKYLSERLNSFFLDKNLPIVIDFFGSLFRFRFVDSYWGITEALFFILLRMNGIETNIQGNCFLTTAHSNEDIEDIIVAVKKSVEKLTENEFFYEAEEAEDDVPQDSNIDQPNSLPITNKAIRTNKASSSDMENLRRFITSDLKKFQQGVN